MHWAVLQFPGSNCDQDVIHVLREVLGQQVSHVWHKDESLNGAEAVVVPGGFSYGDYLRCGAIARWSPVMKTVKAEAAKGMPVIGICNGFQVLCEAGLLPGALIRNRGLHFRCETLPVRVDNAKTIFTKKYEKDQVLQIPIAHGEGNYVADEATLKSLEKNKQIVFTYTDVKGKKSDAANPNGSARNIAGIVNEAGNVLGMMPHPERASEAILGSTDGLALFTSVIKAYAKEKAPVAAAAPLKKVKSMVPAKVR